MDFDTLDKQMRSFELSLDRRMLEGIYIVARLDGHGFTRLTKKEWDLEKPFDTRFRDAMIETVRHLMNCGFRIIYGYTQSDEISLLFHIDASEFGRKERKLISLLASEASVTFSMKVNRPVIFDCRLVPLPNEDYVVDYFRWRQEDSHRNSLNAHCYWRLRKEGVSANEAQKQISRLANSEKNELLFSRGINYNDLPLWQRRGVGLYFNEYEKEGYNPKTCEKTCCMRHTLYLEEELPIGEEYSELVKKIIKDNKNARK